MPDNFRKQKEIRARDNTAHQSLEMDLAGHLRQSGKRTVFRQPNVGSRWGTGGMMPIPDVMTIECSFTKPHITIYEVKAERSDFRRDITSGKWERYLAFCNRLYFATPAGLLKREELPEGVGLIVKGDNGWNSVKAPPHRGDLALDESFWLALLFEGYDFALSVRDNEERRRMVQCALEARPPNFTTNEARAAFRNASQIFGEEVAKQLAGLTERERKLDEGERELARIGERELARIIEELRSVLELEEGVSMYQIRCAVTDRLAQGLGPEVSDVLRKVAYLLEDVARGALHYELSAKVNGLAAAGEAMLEKARENRRHVR